MALEGNAKDFGLSEIFQLISIQQKSGMLSISAEESMAIFFREGMIISTRDRRNRTRDRLKDYLLRYGFIERDEMNNLQQIQTESNMDLTDILLSEKYFSKEELQTIFNDQIYESIQEVLSWPKSHYKFITGMHVLSGVKSFASIKVEGLLMESMRRIDEFPEMLRIFPSEEMLLKRLPKPPGKEIRLEKHEDVIYEILSDEHSLGEVVSISRMARFSTYEALKMLLEKGLLEITQNVVKEDEEEEETTVKSKTRRKKGRIAPAIAAVLILTACCSIGEYLVPRFLPPGWTPASIAGIDDSPVTEDRFLAGSLGQLQLRMLEGSVRESLEEYIASRGSYPVTLEVLVVRKYMSEKVLESVRRNGLIYRMDSNGSSYTLRMN